MLWVPDSWYTYVGHTSMCGQYETCKTMRPVKINCTNRTSLYHIKSCHVHERKMSDIHRPKHRSMDQLRHLEEVAYYVIYVKRIAGNMEHSNGKQCDSWKLIVQTTGVVVFTVHAATLIYRNVQTTAWTNYSTTYGLAHWTWNGRMEYLGTR